MCKNVCAYYRTSSAVNAGSDKDSKRDEDEIETAKEVIQFVKDVRKTFNKNGSIHPNTLNSLSRITTGVNSGRYGFANKTSPKVPADYAR